EERGRTPRIHVVIRAGAHCGPVLAAAPHSSRDLANPAPPLPSLFLTSLLGIFGSPATILPALAEFALPLPSCFLTSLSGIFGSPATILPALAEFSLPLPSCFLTSISVIFGFRASHRPCLP